MRSIVKNQLQLVLLIVLAVATGALGALLLQSHAAQAQVQRPSGFRECFFLVGDAGWSHINNQEHVRNPIGRFPVPESWTVVSGAPNSVLICR